MPVTVTASDAIAYHLWQLPPESTPEVEDGIEYAVLNCPLTDGFRSSVFVGATAGVRTWKLTLPTLASLTVLPNTVTDVTGATVSREQYIRSLYVANRTTNKPFVYLFAGVYYFVDFVDTELTLARMKVKIYVTGFTLRQRRLVGVTLPAP